MPTCNVGTLRRLRFVALNTCWPSIVAVMTPSLCPGVFIFTVVHTPETDLQDGIAGLTAFSARVTDADGDSLTVVAQEPAA